MAIVTCALEELVEIIKQNVKLPSIVEELDCVDQQLRVKINPGKFIPNANLYLNFYSFCDGKIYFKIHSKLPIHFLLKILGKTNINFDGLGCEIKNDMFIIDINKLLSQKIKGLKIKQINFSKNEFEIFT